MSVASLSVVANAELAPAAPPDPYARANEPTIGPAPAPVMEQVFWVQLKLDPATAVEVKTPDGIKLLDRTKPGKGRQWTRFYFRADRGRASTQIEFVPAGGQSIPAPLRVLTYREDIEDKSKGLPGFSPTVRKNGRSYYTDEMVRRAKANIARYETCRSAAQAATQYDRMSDEQLWQSLISWNLPRQCYGNWPCPSCGEKIYEKSAFYPWAVVDTYHCKCPLCGRVFPTNDPSKDDFTSGDYPDDGWGWDSTGAGQRKDAYGWVGYAVERHWQSTGNVIRQLALRCLLLGDRDAGRRAGLLLARLAYVYPGMNMHWQQVLPRYLRVGKIEMDQQWDAMGIVMPALQAYDALWDYLGSDEELARFLGTKDPAIKCPDDVRGLIDVYLVQHVGLNFMRRWYHGDNGGWEQRMANVALLANMIDLSSPTSGPGSARAVSDSWMQELFTHAYNTGVNQGGFQDSMFLNYLTREGPTNIGAPGYSSLSVGYMDAIADALSRYPTERWKSQCDIYDEKLYPRFRALMETYVNLQVAGQFLPNYGDFGNCRGVLGDLISKFRPEYERAYQHWKLDTLARSLFRLGKRQPGLFEVDLWDAIESHVQRLGSEPHAHSRVFDGVGMALLESRSGEPELKDRAGLALRYGYGWGHSHHDNLNVEYWAKNQSVVPELGYPTWVHPLGGTGHAVHHITGMIDRNTQYPAATGKGALEMFAPAAEASFVDCSAQPTGFPAKVYRRAVALLDAPGNGTYVFDVLRLQGGRVRTYCFHGPPFDDFLSNLAFGEKGNPIFGNLMEPQQAQSDNDVVADWKYEQQPLRLRLTMLGQPGRRYLTARYGKVDSPPVRFLLAEEQSQESGGGKDGGESQESAGADASQFVALWEPYEGKPFIEKVERLELARGGEPKGFSPVGVRVTLAGGQTDTLLYANDTATLREVGKTQFRGAFGYLSEAEGQTRCLHLVAGDRLINDGFGLTTDAHDYRAKIIAVDLQEWTMTLDSPIPPGSALEGAQMNIIAGGKHRTTYRIAKVLPAGNVVQVDLSPKIFQSKLEKVSETKDHLVCEIAPPTESGRGFPPGYYDGALLTDETLKARYRVLRVDGQKVYVDRAVKEEDFSATDLYGRRMAHIFDFGEGDEVVLHNSAFLRREEGTRWILQTTCDLKLLLPGPMGEKEAPDHKNVTIERIPLSTRGEGERGGEVIGKPPGHLSPDPSPRVEREAQASSEQLHKNYYRGADGKWRPLQGVSGPDGSISCPLSLSQLSSGRTALVLGKPLWMTLNDHTPPMARRILVDGKPVKLTSGRADLAMREAIRAVNITWADSQNPLNPQGIGVALRIIHGPAPEGSPVSGVRPKRPGPHFIKCGRSPEGSPVSDVRQKITLSDDEKRADVEVSLDALPDGKYFLRFWATDTSPQTNRREVSLSFQIAAPGNLALGALGTKVGVDSCFAGYESLAPINDGSVYQSGEGCLNDVSWASAEQNSDHWIELTFPKPHQVDRVIVYWAIYHRVIQAPTKFRIEVWQDGLWRTVATIEPKQPEPASAATFEPVVTERVRVFMPLGCGPTHRPNLLWVAEVQAFGPIHGQAESRR